MTPTVPALPALPAGETSGSTDAATAEPPPRAELCAAFSQAQAEDPIGMASAAERYVIMELAPPWERDIRHSPHFPPDLAQALERAQAQPLHLTTRFHCIAPDPEYSAPGHTRFLVFQKPAGAIVTFERHEFLVPEALAPAIGASLIARPEVVASLAGFRQRTDHVWDLMVCTHGAKDACCAKFGYPLYERLRRAYAAHSGGRLRAWRTSHFGGHRLAPTLIDFPEGRYWGHLNATALERLVGRDGPVADLRRHYRGWGGLGNHFEQVFEREAFMAEGWAWVTYRKDARTVRVAEDNSRAEVELAFASPDGRAEGMYRGIVEVSGTVPYVHCLEPGHQGETKQYRVMHLEKVEAAIPAADVSAVEEMLM